MGRAHYGNAKINQANQAEANRRYKYKIRELQAQLAAKDAELSKGAADVLAERRRQIESEGFNAIHDDTYGESEKLVHAAVCYAVADGDAGAVASTLWPWSLSWWRPKSKRRNLVRAAALIIAEIDRMDRAALKGGA